MERKKMLPAAETFIAAMRDACAQAPDDRELWERCRELMRPLLADPELRAQAETWPEGSYDGVRADNLLFYEDPDYGFVLNALVKSPQGKAVPHDHGPSWTAYGVLRGKERIQRYDVVTEDDGNTELRESWHEDFESGDIDIVPPWEIHAEQAGDEKTIAFIVRSQKIGTFKQYGYMEGPEPIQIPGPTQLPHDLS